MIIEQLKGVAFKDVISALKLHLYMHQNLSVERRKKKALLSIVLVGE